MTEVESMEKRLRCDIVSRISSMAEHCQQENVPPFDLLKAIIAALSHELVRAAFLLHLSESEFTEMTKIAYREIMPVMRKNMS